MERILLIEDDQALGRGIALALAGEGREIRVAATLAQGRAALGEEEYALVLLDLNLPDGNGLDFLTALRRTSGVPVLILTANDLESDQVAGLELGADDYMTKPFSLMVLVSKVHAFMRRTREAPASCIVSGDILLSLREMKAFRQRPEGGAEPVPLSKKELQLLLLLMENACQILTKEQILERVWGAEGQFVDDNTVPVNISRLRGKIGGSYIQNVRGIGYIWTEESFRE